MQKIKKGSRVIIKAPSILRGAEIIVNSINGDILRGRILTHGTIEHGKIKIIHDSIVSAEIEILLDGVDPVPENYPDKEWFDWINKISPEDVQNQIKTARQKRENNKITQTEIADHMGTKYSNVSDIENLKNYTNNTACRYIYSVDQLTSV